MTLPSRKNRRITAPGTTGPRTACKLALLAVFAGTPAAALAQQPYQPGPARAAVYGTPFPTTVGRTTTSPGQTGQPSQPGQPAVRQANYASPTAPQPPAAAPTAPGDVPAGYRPVAATREAPAPADRSGPAGSGGGGKVMYFHKPADALAPDATPEGGVAMAAAADLPPVAGVPDVPPPLPGVVPPPARPTVADRAIPTAPAFPALTVPPSDPVADPFAARQDVPLKTPQPDAPLKTPQPGDTPPKEFQPKTPPTKDGDPLRDPLVPVANPLPPEVIQLPPRDKIFLMYNDTALEQAVIKSVAQNLGKSGAQGLAFPPLPAVVPPGTTYVAKTASYPPNRAVYEPGFVVHRRQHFEERNSERYGWDLGFVGPLVSAAYFYKDVLLWPNSLASGLETGFWDTSAGKCLPGSPTPYYLYPPGLTVTGLAAEAAVFVPFGFFLHPVGGGNALGPFIH